MDQDVPAGAQGYTTMKIEQVKRVGVVGAGLMGQGIALNFAVAGYPVTMTDTSEENLARAIGKQKDMLAALVEHGLVDITTACEVPGRIATHTSLEESMGDADFVIEAVFEDLGLKHRIFAELDAYCPSHAVLTSNTSSFMTSQIAPATYRTDKVLVANWWNPAHLLPLVEVVRGPETSDQTVEITMSLLESIGKRPVVLQKESPGFVGNRLQFALLREALSIVEKGIASPEDVDTVVKTSFGRRLAVAGPFEVFDMGGWDTIAHIADELFPDLEIRADSPVTITELVDRGDLGVKTGRGFYEWNDESVIALRQRITNALTAIDQL
jgi:3-hydroxybutyryl-CoA dehydrogenase